METVSISGITLFYEREESWAATLIGESCQQSVRVIRELWNFPTPPDCRVYVMTGWLPFVFHAAPMIWRVALVLTGPFWMPKTARMWPYAGGFARRFGKRQVVGVKPPRLIRLGDASLGEQIFTPVPNAEEKVRHVVCHELTHAFSAHLNPPAWLNEGLALLTEERLFDKPTLRTETLERLGSAQDAQPRGYAQLSTRDPQALLDTVVRGYWVTRYLAEVHPETLRDLLTEQRGRDSCKDRLAMDLDASSDSIWLDLAGRAASHFSG